MLVRIVLFAALLTCLTATPAAAADPTNRPARTGPDGYPKAGPLNVERQAILDEKQAMSSLFARLRDGEVDAATFDAAQVRFEAKYGRSPLRDSTGGADTHRVGMPQMYLYPVQKYLNALTQVAQATDSYCGPASAYEVLAALGYSTSYHSESLSQTTLANTTYLETDSWGNTPWSTCSGCRPMPESLNYWMTGSYSGFYAAVGLPNAVSLTTYKDNLQYDIYYGYPLVANEHEKIGKAHLVGHPDQDIKHWTAIYGYNNSGDTTAYADSVHGTTFWTWSNNVPAYSYISSSTLVSAMLLDSGYADRGYIW